MNFRYEELGINVNFSDEEKEKIVAIKNNPNRYTSHDSEYDRAKIGKQLTVSGKVFGNRAQDYFIKNSEKYLKLVRDIWEADKWCIDRYYPGYEYKIYKVQPLKGLDIY